MRAFDASLFFSNQHTCDASNYRIRLDFGRQQNHPSNPIRHLLLCLLLSNIQKYSSNRTNCVQVVVIKDKNNTALPFRRRIYSEKDPEEDLEAHTIWGQYLEPEF
jgi:hypothetical protein